MPPVVLVARDHTLDIALESESHLILVVVAIAVGLLFIVTTIIIHGSRLLEIMRRYMRLSSRIAKGPELEKSEPANLPTIQVTPVPSMPQSISTPQIRQALKLSNSHRISTNFFTLRRHPSAPHRPPGVYAGVKRMPFSPSPPDSHDSPLPQQQTSPPGVVTPHVAEWMKVADSVVGRHPNAQPLHMRVATQAEVDLISGHVHIPWASKSRGRSQMVPVMVTKPTTIILSPPVANLGISKDVGNIRPSKIIVFVDKTSSKSSKGKKVFRPRGKENLPPTSLPLVHIYSGRRN